MRGQLLGSERVWPSLWERGFGDLAQYRKETGLIFQLGGQARARKARLGSAFVEYIAQAFVWPIANNKSEILQAIKAFFERFFWQ
jgi:hypothetical protein